MRLDDHETWRVVSQRLNIRMMQATPQRRFRSRIVKKLTPSTLIQLNSASTTVLVAGLLHAVSHGSELVGAKTHTISPKRARGDTWLIGGMLERSLEI
jgi:hypothetical protein